MIGLPPNLLSLALQLLLIALLVLLAGLALGKATARLERRLEGEGRHPQRRARLRTMLRAGRGLAFALVLAAAGLAALRLFGIDITPVLAGAGVIGLGLSLGAQFLIRDFLGGLIILIEDHYHVGDVVKVGAISGTVERITLRATYLRDGEGQLHIVPNGDIRTVSNLTADWSRAVVDFSIDLSADMAQALAALQQACDRTAADEKVRDDLLDPPEVAAWNGMTDWGTQVRLMARTRPGKQWGVARALRRYGVEALQSAGIPLAVPRQTLWMQPPGSGSSGEKP
ncbi:MAG: mechanosensitive ion channel family protein [Anaerolineales bacterium]